MQDKNLHNVGIIFDVIKKRYNLRTYRELAAFLGVKEGTLNAWKTRNSIGNIDAILARCKGMNYEWIKTGQGKMFLEDDNPYQTTKSTTHSPISSGHSANNNLSIPPHEEIIREFQDKDLARLINYKLIEIEKINPSALIEIYEILRSKLKILIESQEKDLLSAEEKGRDLKDGTTG